MKAIKLKSLRCFAALAASVLLFTAGLVSCSDSDEPDVSNPPVITPSETEEQKSLYGTYWGSLTVAGQSYDMALVANGTTAALYSTMMTQSYPVVKYVKNADGTYTLHCYNSGEDTTADSTHVKVTFTLGENGSVTCVPLIVPMAAMAQFSTCTKGNAYNGEYDQGQGGQQGQQTVTDYSPYYGTFEGAVMKQTVTLTVSEASVDQGGNYGAYTKVLWLTDSNNKAVIAAQNDSTNTKNGDLTVENYTTASSCYIVFESEGKAAYFVPAMAKMMPDGAEFYRVETLSVDATLSCFVNAMGGVEFGTPIYRNTTITTKAGGTAKATLNLGTGTGNIYTGDFVEFVEPRNSTPGYYDADGNVQNAEYTLSKDDTATPPSADEDAENGVHYVTSMTFPVSKDVSEYNLWVYINSNVMGVQFCDGNGTAGSGEPGKATPYVGKLTINWESLAKTN